MAELLLGASPLKRRFQRFASRERIDHVGALGCGHGMRSSRAVRWLQAVPEPAQTLKGLLRECARQEAR